MRIPPIWRYAGVITITVGLALIASGPASAATTRSPSGLQATVAAYAARHPGGHQINATEIAYQGPTGSTLIVTVVRPTTAQSGPDCTLGWFCFYDGVNYGYPRGRLSDCGWQDLGWWGWRDRTESVSYNLSIGSVVFIAETGAIDTSLFTISTTRRNIADVTPNRNRADYVFRYCS